MSAAVDDEAARLRHQHGYSWLEAYAMAELTVLFRSLGVTLVALDDLPAAKAVKG